MQERCTSPRGTRRIRCLDPFFVLATQNLRSSRRGPTCSPRPSSTDSVLNILRALSDGRRGAFWRSSARTTGEAGCHLAGVTTPLGRADRERSRGSSAACKMVPEHVFVHAQDLVGQLGPNQAEATPLLREEVRLLGRGGLGLRSTADPRREDAGRARRPVRRDGRRSSGISPGRSSGIGSSPRSTPRPRGSTRTR